jgi:phospholipid/cholesterol/gamma-HCH transport system substrate-binding protein
MKLLRTADEWIGLLVVLAVVIFVGALLRAGVLHDWFRTVSTLRIILPEAGVAGLAVGADVEILGTKAGTVRRIVLNPNEVMYAEAVIEDQARVFVRRDSKAVLRRRFGVAGAAFIDITRGKGATIDWTFAVLQGESERAPTENVGALVDQVREKVFPILDDAGRTMRALAATMERIEKGQGNVGRLLADEQMARDIEATVAQLRAAAAELGRVSKDLAELTRSAGAPDGVPSILRRADQALATLQGALRNVARATQSAPKITRNIESSTASLPTVLIQTQQTTRELEELLAQLRQHWLLRGERRQEADRPRRLSPAEIRP